MDIGILTASGTGKVESNSIVIRRPGQEDMYLLGHIYIGAHKLHTELERRGIEGEETKRIVHCVLAHHGCLEFGSPVVPCTPEAELISHLDDISAKTDNMEGTGNLEKSFALGTCVVK